MQSRNNSKIQMFLTSVLCIQYLYQNFILFFFTSLQPGVPHFAVGNQGSHWPQRSLTEHFVALPGSQVEDESHCHDDNSQNSKHPPPHGREDADNKMKKRSKFSSNNRRQQIQTRKTSRGKAGVEKDNLDRSEGQAEKMSKRNREDIAI